MTDEVRALLAAAEDAERRYEMYIKIAASLFALFFIASVVTISALAASFRRDMLNLTIL